MSSLTEVVAFLAYMFAVLVGTVAGMVLLGMPVALPEARRPVAIVGSDMLDLMSPKMGGRTCTKALRQFRGVPVRYTAVLDGTFGRRKGCLRRFLSKRAVRTIVEIHPTNEAGRRNRRLKDGEFFRRLSPARLSRAFERRDVEVEEAYRLRIRRWTDFAAPYGARGVEFEMTTGLETNGSVRSEARKVEIIREEWPYGVVWNPQAYRGGFARVGADGLELHTYDPSAFPAGLPCVSSADGVQFDLGSDELVRGLRAITARCRRVRVWDQAISNGYRGSSWVPPRRRGFAFDPEVVRAVNRLLRTFNGTRRD